MLMIYIEETENLKKSMRQERRNSLWVDSLFTAATSFAVKAHTRVWQNSAVLSRPQLAAVAVQVVILQVV
jgi:hypothetical protein